ncbi:MAG TPA: hypothetical protein VF618_22745 [Thermoanaerobaculia bacterium]
MPGTTIIGVLEQVSAREGLSGIVREPDGTRWTCRFAPDEMLRLRDAWTHTVRIVGAWTGEAIEVCEFLFGDEEIAQRADYDRLHHDSWRPKTLEELAREK